MTPQETGARCHESRLDRDEWPRFFDRFSADHARARVSLEYTSPDAGPIELVHEVPLVGITASTEHGSAMTIEMIFEGAADRYLSHTIDEPSRVVECDAGASGPGWLEIESSAGEVVTVRWQSP